MASPPVRFPLAHVAEVEVSKNGAVRVGASCVPWIGLMVNLTYPLPTHRGGGRIQSGIIFGTTAALYGEITVKNGQVEQTNFDTYWSLHQRGAEIEVYLSKAPEPPVGWSECGTSCIVRKVANAIFCGNGEALAKMPVDTAALKPSRNRPSQFEHDDDETIDH